MTLRQRLESACALNELSETLKNSTRVVAWYAHGPGDQSPLDTATVRGPYGRWFYVNGGADYPKNVAYVADDAKYAAASMNAIPKLIPLITHLCAVVEASIAISSYVETTQESQMGKAVTAVMIDPITQIRRHADAMEYRDSAIHKYREGLAALEKVVGELCGEGK